MSIKTSYQTLVNTHQLDSDSAQIAAVNALDQLQSSLHHQQKKRHDLTDNQRPIFRFIRSVFSRLRTTNQQPFIQGIYFYGQVGRGKTMLMDLFYQQLTIEKKQRIHFHHFMESVHQQLNALSMQYIQPDRPIRNFTNKTNKSKATQNRATENPLIYVARDWATKVQVLCFDEFFVNDIGDAILLAGLFDEMFKQGIVLVATSNCKPEQLYKNGLQRERFLPTIDLIKRYCQVISVNGEKDHRIPKHHQGSCHPNSIQKVNSPYPVYAFPHNKHQDFIQQQFEDKAPQSLWQPGLILINHRSIRYLAISMGEQHSIIAFDFYALCSAPRSQRDYMVLAKTFKQVLISGVPQFCGKLIPAVFSGVEERYQRSGIVMKDLRQLDDEARRFIALIDEFYDQKIAVIISAEVDIIDLYQGQQLAFEFARCRSRLFEMQNFCT
tara:strand:+ start:450 stop:1763 length:1314 start_codon:yes stop_codon:yes gene_type:complete